MMIERMVASTAGMIAVVYLLASLVAWHRVFFFRRNGSFGDSIILDRAIGWLGYSSLFFMIAGAKLHLVDWTDNLINIGLITINLAIFISALVSVRAITVAAFGNKILTVFTIASTFVGALIFFL